MLSVLTQTLNLLSLWIIFSPILKLFNIFLGKILDIMAKNLESWSGCIRSWSRLPRSWPRSIRFFRWVPGIPPAAPGVVVPRVGSPVRRHPLVPRVGSPVRRHPLVPRVGSPVCCHPAYEQVEGPPLLEPVEQVSPPVHLNLVVPFYFQSS